jgi:carbon monoxide dehydrogenase subunit G
VRIENEFTVSAPVDDVFAFLADVERVAPCMPGATIVGRDDAGRHQGRFRIKVGPVSAAYEGTIAAVSQDRGDGRIVLRGSGSDPRGAGSAAATIAVHVADLGGSTSVRMETDLDVSGRLAQFSGRSSLMQGVADRMIGQLADRLEQQLSAPPQTADTPAAAAAAPAGTQPSPIRTAPAPASAERIDAGGEAEAFDAGALLRDVAGGRPALFAATAVACAVLALALLRRRRPRGRRIELHF